MSPLTKRLIAALVFALPIAALSAPSAMAKQTPQSQTQVHKGKGKSTAHAQGKRGKHHAHNTPGKTKRSTAVS